MQIIYMDHITRLFAETHPDYLFVFGDNNLRTGRGGQAAALRGLSNSIGIRTKYTPHSFNGSFFSDDYYDLYKWQTDMIKEDISKLIRESVHYTHLVMPSAGIGTGRAELPVRAPKTYTFLCQMLKDIGIRNGVSL